MFLISIGALLAMAFVGIGVCIGRIDNGNYKGEFDGDNNHDVHLVERSNNRSGDNGCNKSVEPEEIELVLYNLRIGASDREKRVIDYLIDEKGVKDEK